jgi:hypothetical protein
VLCWVSPCFVLFCFPALDLFRSPVAYTFRIAGTPLGNVTMQIHIIPSCAAQFPTSFRKTCIKRRHRGPHSPHPPLQPFYSPSPSLPYSYSHISPLLLPFSPKWLAQLSLTDRPHPCSPPSATSGHLGKSDRTTPFLMISRAHYPWPAFVVPRDQDSRIPLPNASNDV